MKIKIFWPLLLLFCLCIYSGSSEAAEWFGFEGSFGYDYSDNVIYAPITTKEGDDYVRRNDFKFHLSPKIVDWFSTKATYRLSMDEYSIRPEYNSSGHTGEIELGWNPLGTNYFYLTLGASSYNIGAKTPYYNKSIDLQYIFDITQSGSFWTTIYYKNNDEGYVSLFYEPLNNVNSTIGLRQHVTESFYFYGEAIDLNARYGVLSYSEKLGSVVIKHAGAFFTEYKISISYKERAYKESSNITSIPKRRDQEASASISVTKDLIGGLSLKGIYSYTRNYCNLKKEQTLQGYAGYIENVFGVYLALKI